MANALQLNVLGRFELRAESDPIGPIANKAQAMLAYLAVENDRVKLTNKYEQF